MQSETFRGEVRRSSFALKVVNILSSFQTLMLPVSTSISVITACFSLATWPYIRWYILYHTSQNQSLYKMNWPKSLAYYISTPATLGTNPNNQSNHRLQVFWKKWFFPFFRPKNEFLRVFWDPNEVFRGS